MTSPRTWRRRSAERSARAELRSPDPRTGRKTAVCRPSRGGTQRHGEFRAADIIAGRALASNACWMSPPVASHALSPLPNSLPFGLEPGQTTWGSSLGDPNIGRNIQAEYVGSFFSGGSWVLAIRCAVPIPGTEQCFVRRASDSRGTFLDAPPYAIGDGDCRAGLTCSCILPGIGNTIGTRSR